MITKEITLNNRSGLHAKPVSTFVRAANKFHSEIFISKDSVKANAKSIMGVIILAVQQGDTIVLEAEGDDEQEAIESLTELIDSKFGIEAEA